MTDRRNKVLAAVFQGPGQMEVTIETIPKRLMAKRGYEIITMLSLS